MTDSEIGMPTPHRSLKNIPKIYGIVKMFLVEETCILREG